MWESLEEWGIRRYASKAIGFVAAIVTSHVITLLTSPEFQGAWASWGLKLQVVDKAAFQAKLSLILGIVWISIDHFVSRLTEKKAGN